MPCNSECSPIWVASSAWMGHHYTWEHCCTSTEKGESYDLPFIKQLPPGHRSKNMKLQIASSLNGDWYINRKLSSHLLANQHTSTKHKINHTPYSMGKIALTIIWSTLDILIKNTTCSLKSLHVFLLSPTNTLCWTPHWCDHQRLGRQEGQYFWNPPGSR